MFDLPLPATLGAGAHPVTAHPCPLADARVVEHVVLGMLVRWLAGHERQNVVDLERLQADRAPAGRRSHVLRHRERFEGRRRGRRRRRRRRREHVSPHLQLWQVPIPQNPMRGHGRLRHAVGSAHRVAPKQLPPQAVQTSVHPLGSRAWGRRACRRRCALQHYGRVGARRRHPTAPASGGVGDLKERVRRVAVTAVRQADQGARLPVAPG